MKSIGLTLKKLREENNMTGKDAVEALTKYGINISDKTLYGYEKNRNSPNADMFIALCKVYRCTNILGTFDNGDMNILFTNSEFRHIEKYRDLDHHGKDMVDTVLDKEYERRISPIKTDEAADSIILPFPVMPASAGAGEYLDSLPDEMIRVKTTPESRLADFALKVAGDSMEPAYSDGDTILVQRTEELEIGDVGVFIVNNEGYIKRLGEEGLESLNPDYNGVPVYTDDDFRTIGKVLDKAEIV